MNSVAQFSPDAYVNSLQALPIPNYTGDPGGEVAITSYLSANPSFGGSAKASVVASAMHRIVRGKPEMADTQTAGFSRVFTGQGMRDDFITAMSIVNKYSAEFRAVPQLARYFAQSDFLQAMSDDACFGLDCIGFVGTYLAEAAVESAYVGRRPLDYTAAFPPVQTLDAITDLAVVMLTNGQHIQIIDEVTERGNGYIKVDLCQSSSGGPQTNCGVTIRSGGGSYLPVEAFRAAMSSHSQDSQWQADNQSRQSQGLAARDYATYLRATMTQTNVQRGFAGGAIFQLSAGGDPHNPVGGSVYVGVAKNGLSVGTP